MKWKRGEKIKIKGGATKEPNGEVWPGGGGGNADDDEWSSESRWVCMLLKAAILKIRESERYARWNRTFFLLLDSTFCYKLQDKGFFVQDLSLS